MKSITLVNSNRLSMEFLFMGIYSVIMTSFSFSSGSSPSSFQSSTTSYVSSTLLLGSVASISKRQEVISVSRRPLRLLNDKGRNCDVQEMPNLEKKMLQTSEVSCNDGSPAGYYIRRSEGSSKWIVLLEGGWYCFDHISCSERFRVMRDYMSSKNWPKYRSGSGILSWDPEENPYHYNSNVVYIPYCSSDSWSGTRNKTSVMDFSFLGSLILDKIFKELLRKGMKQAKTVILAGTSAGGTGVLINLDRIADLINDVSPKIKVMGLVDAGWFLDNESFKAKPCRDSFTCSPMVGIQKGTRVWEPKLPVNCTTQYPTEIWRCFFGHRVYPYVKSPVYIIQNLYDAAQIHVNNVFEENMHNQLSSEQWRYLLNLGEEMKQTLENVSEWHKLRIEGTSLAESIHCWEISNSKHLPCQESSSQDKRNMRETGKQKRKQKGKKKWKNGKKGRKYNRNSKPKTKHCQHKLIDECPWPHCNCSCLKSRWEALSQAHQFFLKTLAAVMGIDPGKMIKIRLCGS